MKNLTRYKSQFSQKGKGRNKYWEWEQIWRQQLLQSVKRGGGREGRKLATCQATPFGQCPCDALVCKLALLAGLSARQHAFQVDASTATSTGTAGGFSSCSCLPTATSCLLLTMTRQVLSPSPGCLTGSRSAGGGLRVKFKTVITPQLSHASFLPQGTRASTFHVPLMFLV